MTTWFWVTALAFHVLVLALGVLAVRRLTSRAARGGVWVSLIGESVFYGVALSALAVAFARAGPPSEFTTIRLISQALFGELPLMGGALALLLARRGRLGEAFACGLMSVALVAVYWDAYHREPQDLRVRTHAIDLAQGECRGRLRVLHLSDIQVDRVGDYQRRALAQARALRPDLVVWSGDYVQPRLSGSRAAATAELRALLAHMPIPARLGAFAVRGDVDQDWPSVFEGTGVAPLTGEIARVPLDAGRTLSLIGLSPEMSRGQDDAGLHQLVARAPRGDLRVVLAHNPNFVASLGPGCADLALAGHTHGGQVVLPFFGAPYTDTRLPRRFASGLNDYDGVPLHVTAGIGLERAAAPQIRFLCPPEICIVEISY
jgi:predicted MPP superfamily phosphohydrolase